VSKAKRRTKRKGFRLPADLAVWAEKYAASKYTTVTQLIVDLLLAEKQRTEQ
jgi:hypothetical protein